MISLHGQLPVRGLGRRAGARRTRGSATCRRPAARFPASCRDVVRELRRARAARRARDRGPCFGGRARGDHGRRRRSTPGSRRSAGTPRSPGPGPGILGSATALGHGGLAALDTAHAALALGCRDDRRAAHVVGRPARRATAASRTTRAPCSSLLLRPALVALPAGRGTRSLPGEHEAARGRRPTSTATATSGPARAYDGPRIDEDELFFRAALAGGACWRRQIDGV